jgi:hypothetical protein
MFKNVRSGVEDRRDRSGFIFTREGSGYRCMMQDKMRDARPGHTPAANCIRMLVVSKGFTLGDAQCNVSAS